jgi:hypothetical protein
MKENIHKNLLFSVKTSGCKTRSSLILYNLECSVCGLQNLGESKQPFHKRLNGHRSDLTHKSFLPVSQHFGLSDHSLEDFNRMKILVIEHNKVQDLCSPPLIKIRWHNYNSLNSQVTKCDALK